MKKLLITIAVIVLLGCGESQELTPTPEGTPVEPVAKVSTPEPPTAKAPDISIDEAAASGNIEAVRQHIAAGTDVNIKDDDGFTALYFAAQEGQKEIAELLIEKGADVNVKLESQTAKENGMGGATPLRGAAYTWCGVGHGTGIWKAARHFSTSLSDKFPLAATEAVGQVAAQLAVATVGYGTPL